MADGWLVTKEHIKNCRTSAWIELFRPFALKTIVLPLPFPLVQRLAADGIQVAGSVFPKAPENEWEVKVKGEEEVVWDEVEQEGGKGFCSGFDEFEQSVKGAVEELGGVVVPKLTWSCPIDALFVSCEGNLKCRSVEEIFILLQSSDLIVHDLFHAFDECDDEIEATNGSQDVAQQNQQQQQQQQQQPSGGEEKEEKETIIDVEHSLVLKKWANLRNGREMRCFVYQNQLRGICQRDPTAFYSFLLEEKEEIKERIAAFYKKNIHEKFPDPCFVMDVYVDRSYRVWLLDINPFASSTKPLMFEWEELTTPPSSSSSSPLDVDFRIVESQRNIQMADTMLNRVPLDMFNVESAQGLQEFISMCQAEEKKLQEVQK